MDGQVSEVNKEVKGFKRASLKETSTTVKDHKPTQQGVFANAFLLTLFIYIFNGDFFFFFANMV